MTPYYDNLNAVVDTYRRRAKRYDLTANLYYLAGFREWAYRKRAIEALTLHPGSTVVEVGCGTGLNFSLLQQRVGPRGRIIGVDLTDAMLEQARRRVDRAGWTNVDLVRSDAAEYTFPDGVDGILSTFALSLSPRCGEIIDHSSRALASGGRWVVLDLKPPRRLPGLVRGIMPILRPFAINEQILARRPWEQISRALCKNLEPGKGSEWYGGMAYLAWGERRQERDK